MSASAPAATAADLERALLDLDEVAVTRLLDAGGRGPDADVLENVVVPALVSIGDAWERGEVALSQVYMSGRLCERVIGSFDGSGFEARASQPRISIVVLDDAHILGKQIVVQMLRSTGYRVDDLGARQTVSDVVEAVARDGTEVLVVSVLMLRAALAVRELRAALTARGLHPVLVVGGAPFRFDPALVDEVGADYGGASASDILSIMASIEASRR